MDFHFDRIFGIVLVCELYTLFYVCLLKCMRRERAIHQFQNTDENVVLMYVNNINGNNNFVKANINTHKQWKVSVVCI